MTSEQLKEDILHKVRLACVSWAPPEQCQRIENILRIALDGVTVIKEETALSTDVIAPNEEYIKQFLAIKLVKGLSHRTLKYYELTIRKFFSVVDKPVADITSNDIRVYLAIREMRDGISKVTLGNELRNLRSFFGTLAQEDLIPKNPTAKIDAVKTEKKVKEPFTELEMEQIRRGCQNRRGLNKKHLAIVEVLYSTACRVSELCGMNRNDLNGDQIKVLGKGNKERICYLTPRAQIALKDYLDTRQDDFPAMFIGENIVTAEPTARMTPSSVEQIIRTIGKRAGVPNCHPHRFRRTAATVALRRGMPIEQVSKMLGHEQIGTTQIYAITAESQVKDSHKKYLT